MTEQEKRQKTMRYLRLIRSNYRLLKREEETVVELSDKNRRVAAQIRWLTAAEEACRLLKEKGGKSRARIRHDWLVARTLEITVYQNTGGERLRAQLAGPRMLNQRYVRQMLEAAVRAVQAAAERAGLFNE